MNSVIAMLTAFIVLGLFSRGYGDKRTNVGVMLVTLAYVAYAEYHG